MSKTKTKPNTPEATERSVQLSEAQFWKLTALTQQFNASAPAYVRHMKDVAELRAHLQSVGLESLGPNGVPYALDATTLTVRFDPTKSTA